MCAAAIESPTTAEEKNSFVRIPRRVNAFASRNRPGCVTRYNGSAEGTTTVTVSAAVTTARRSDNAILEARKFSYDVFVSYVAAHNGQPFSSCKKSKIGRAS